MRIFIITITFIFLGIPNAFSQYIISDTLTSKLEKKEKFPRHIQTNKLPQTKVNLSGFIKSGLYHQNPNHHSNDYVSNSIKWDAGLEIEFIHQLNNGLEFGSIFGIRGYTSNDYNENISSYTNNNGQIERAYLFLNSNIGQLSIGITDAIQESVIPNGPNFGAATGADSDLSVANWSAVNIPSNTYNYTNISITKRSNKLNIFLPNILFFKIGMSYTPIFTESSAQGGVTSGNSSIVLKSSNVYENVLSIGGFLSESSKNFDIKLGASYETAKNTPSGSIRISQRLETIAVGGLININKISFGGRLTQTKYGNNFLNKGFHGSASVQIINDISVGAGYMQNKDDISSNQFSRLGAGVTYNIMEGVDLGGIYKLEKAKQNNFTTSTTTFGIEFKGFF